MNPLFLLPCAVFSLLFAFVKEGVGQLHDYRGKTIVFLRGVEPGGLGDLRNKVVMEFVPKYIPGQPSVVSEYMPGASARKLANHIYHSAKGDGLTVCATSPGILASAVSGMSEFKFNAVNFIYLGSPFSENNNMFVARKALGIHSVEKLREHAGLRVGGQSVGHVRS